MRRSGKIFEWHDDRGYGFIAPSDGGDKVFVHIKAFPQDARRPGEGDAVMFSMGRDHRGRACATAANTPGARQTTRASRRGPTVQRVELLAGGFLLFVAAAVYGDGLPVSVLVFYVGATALTFVAYALDKSSARSGGWRTRESTLHVFALLGGWPGALVAQQRLRHKSRKQPFRAIFWLTVVANGAAFAGLFTPEGARAWRLLVAIFAS